MSAFKGTPGPWRSVPAHRNSKYTRYVLGPGEDEEVADVFGGANTDLIAAAPELLKRLEQMVYEWVKLANSGDCGSWDPETDSCVQLAREAIAAALGEVPL